MDSCALTKSGCRPENGVCDMIVISDIDENGINTNLKCRYIKEKIYTYTGAILVSVNPYKSLPIYEQENVSQYCGKKLNQEEPHIFAIAEAAYQNLQGEAINQSCIISGESGAGKTESTKFILQYLCSVTNHVSIWVEQQILEANTLLEAFGNAKTVRNDNSSRFGKFMQVCFDGVNQIKGCIIQDYLLEQSRITFQSPDERNYHVFYQLLAAAKNIPELKDQFFLGPPESYDYLNQSGCYALSGVDDAQMFDNLRLAMNVLNIPPEMMDGIFAVLSAVLLLGNIKFEDDDGERCHLTDADSEIANTICCMLGLDFERFTEVCLYRQIQVRGMITSIPYKVNEAIENRHAMAKALYSRTFAWLVDSINKCTNPGCHQTKFIGILDIFGFENFKTNSFEQLCINYTNEKLHKFFNHYVFALEQELYTEEGISFSHINFTDNTLCLELIEKAPKCILKILDEECRFPQGTDKTYIAKQHQAVEGHQYYVKGDRRLWEREFGLQHYAGVVTYNVEGFLNKNKDTQQDQLFDLMFNSNNDFVKDLTRFQDLLGVRLEDLGGRSTISRTSRSKPTVADTFKHQLSALVDVLGFTNPWYVRCLKPNVKKLPDSYIDEDVLTQLRYSGMLDIIRIKKEGYPVHVDISLFLEKYRCLLNLPPGPEGSEEENRTAILNLMNSLNLPMSEWQLGKTKVFLRNKVFEPLEEKRQVLLTRVTILIQKIWRGYRDRRAYLRIRNAVIVLQANFRVMRDRIAFLRMKRATIVIQAFGRGMLARRLAKVERAKKRAEEERLREEEIERERQLREKEAADELAMEDSMIPKRSRYYKLLGGLQLRVRESQAALESLTKTIESMWEKHHIDVTPSSLDLDEMFNFLDSLDGTGSPVTSQREFSEKEKALELINQEFDDLDLLLENSTQILKEMSHGDEEEIQTNGLENGESLDIVPPPPPLPVQLELSMDNAEEFTGADLPPPPPPPPVPPTPPSPPTSPLSNNASSSGINTSLDISAEIKNLSAESLTNGDDEVPCPPPAPPIPPPVQTLPLSLQVPVEVNVSGGTVIIPPPPSHAPPSPPPLPSLETGMPSELNNGMLDNSISITSSPVLAPSPILHSDSTLNQLPGHLLETPPTPSVIRECEVDSTRFSRLSTTLEIEPCDILEYAEENFNEHVRGFTGSVMKSLKRKTADVLRKDEMLQYNKSGAIPTSHIRLHDIENIQMACNIFKEMTRYIREDLRPEAMIHTIQYVVKCGIERIELRDEIFCQLIRQTNHNPEVDGLTRAWCLFCHCTAAFSPTKSLNKYLAYYIWQNTEVEGIGNYAKQSLKQLRTQKIMTRKYPPSAIEISSTQTLTPMVCRVYFMDGKTKAVSVMPCDTMAEVLEKVAVKIGLKWVEGWAIYEVTADYERFIRSYEYMADILSQWEVQHRSFNTLSKYDTVSRKAGKALANGVEEARFVFRKRVYRHVHDIPNDPVEYHLLFSEAVHKVVTMDEFSVSEKVALQLAGLQARVVLGPYEDGKETRYTDINQYLCKRIASISNRNWPKEIMEAHKNYTSGKTELEAKVWYLTCVKQFPLYGCTFFSITHKGMWGHKGSTLLAINMDGVKFIKAKDKTVIHDFKYCDIETFAVDANENYISFELKNDSYSRCPQRSFIFETNQKEDIGFLTASYSAAHTSWLKTDPDNLKKVKMSDDDKLRVYSELVSCRAALVESQCLKKPSQETSGMGILRNTLRKLTKSKMEKLRRYSLGNLDGVFNLAYWSYNKAPTNQSLLAFSDPQEEENSIRMYNGMLGMDGTNDSGNNEMASQMCQAQKIIQKGMENSHQCNELYLQLIKQTTDNPEPESRLNQWYWQVMCVATSSIVPPNPLILNYLQTHLKKCSMDTKTEEGKYARFSHKCLNRNISKKPRKFPPSIAEIQYIFQRRNIKEKIYFVNGELRIIEFDSAATAEEVVKIIKTKLGMRSDAEGFALFEVMGTTEKTMAVEERMSDTISKWDRWAKGNYSTKELRILFKKRLFITPYLNVNDPVECELVFHQLIEDVFEQKIPISETDAVQLCALKLQSELDGCPLEEVDYSSVMRILPREVRPCISVEKIAIAHQAIASLSPHEAILAFIEILKSWLFFGSTVFEVKQGYTTAMPKTLLLLINEAGLHVVHTKLSRVFGSYPHVDITCTSPSLQSIMIIIGQVAKGTKYVFNTTQASEISGLIKEYSQELKRKRSLNQKNRQSQSMSERNGLSVSESLTFSST